MKISAVKCLAGLFKNYIDLTRSLLSSTVALTAAAGFILFHRRIDAAILQVFTGVYLFACAASALNQYLENKTDAVMERTKNRPLVDQKIKRSLAVIIIIVNFTAGLLIFQLFFNLKAALIACSNLIWYNAVYTPLKRKTSFAVLTGALAGAVPPVIGWTAAGGYLFDPIIISISFYLFMWQIPHFMFFYLKYSSDYFKAGFPELFNISIKQSYSVIIYIWLIGTVLSSMLLILSGVVSGFIQSTILSTWNLFFLIYYFFSMILKFDKTINKLIYPLYIHQACIFILLILTAI
jgi:heme o synthase